MNTYNFTYIISLLLIFFGCNQNIDGCLDAEACNYNPDANVDDGSCEYGGLTSDWNIQIIASMQPWNILDTIFDENNILGVSDSTSDDFDSMDIPEPPSSPDPNWISGYFYHPEWDSIFGDNFTQEYKSNQFCGTKEWDFIVKANSPGPMELFFIFNNVPDSVQISLVGEESTIISDSLVVSSVLDENVPKEFLIKVNIN
mgnify:CR=1 FL=1